MVLKRTMTFQVIVCLAEGRNITIDLGSKKSTTVLELKQKIAKKLPGDRGNRTEMKLIFADKRLEKDHKRLSDYGIVHQSVIRIQQKWKISDSCLTPELRIF
uniref:Ubiquitin-like domain-containing protein n=1 Tax=Poecilia reticulata TaxID=8081 RepID=A0A3P9NCI0_POERE